MTEREKRVNEMVLDGAECSHIAEWWNCERCKYSPCGARRTCENLVEKDYRKADDVRKETLLRLFDIARNSPYSELDIMILKELIKKEFGVEVEE